MGRLGAEAFADQITEGNTNLRAALSWHLRSNNFPPLPAFFIPTCIAAIEAGQDEDWDRELPLPRGCATHKTPVDLDASTCVYGETTDDAKDFGTCEITNIVTWKDDRDVVTAGALIESFHLDSFL